jgi:LacI family transcriptional regulator
VSPATVSRVIQGAKNVHPATREKVRRAIEELGYVPSAVAQSLRSKRTRSLALVVSDITNTYWTTVARGVEDEAQGQGYSVLLCNTDENLAKQLRYLDLLIGQQVDGVIIAPFDVDARHLDKLRQRSIPTVVIDRRIEGWDVDSVCGDSISGAGALVQHLIGLGHTRIAVVSGPRNTSTAEDRVTGYCQALDGAGIPVDPKLIKRGEYRASTGEALTNELLDEGLNPTAIFATNNAIAMGVIDALAKRGLRIPQDIALVSFDDLPDLSHLFPFLTVVAQPAYDMGVNAAQLLLSRLSSEVDLRPRHVVLPSRLIVRHSCGSHLSDSGQCPLSLPILSALAQSVLVKSPSPGERHGLSGTDRAGLDLDMGVADLISGAPGRHVGMDKSDLNRLLKVLQHQEADRVPYIEFEVTGRAVYEYVLEHEVVYDATSARLGAQSARPEDHVEFALRLGMDAVHCNFFWHPQQARLDDVEPPPALTDQLSYLERYLRAAQGTHVGVIVSFSSFFDRALLASGVLRDPQWLKADRAGLEQLMDTILENQEKAMRVVCDRFREDLALVMIRDNIAQQAGLVFPSELFMAMFQPRMERLIGPAKEHGLLLVMHTSGRLDESLPILYDMGFDGIHPVEAECNDIFEVRKNWTGKLAILGNIPTTLLAEGRCDEIEAVVRDYCVRLAAGGGYVVSSSGPISDDIPPANLVAMARAVHKHGRYGSLGQGTPQAQVRQVDPRL